MVASQLNSTTYNQQQSWGNCIARNTSGYNIVGMRPVK